VAAQFIDALDMLPPHAVGAHRIFRRRGRLVLAGEQGAGDVVGVGGLGQIVDRP